MKVIDLFSIMSNMIYNCKHCNINVLVCQYIFDLKIHDLDRNESSGYLFHKLGEILLSTAVIDDSVQSEILLS